MEAWRTPERRHRMITKIAEAQRAYPGVLNRSPGDIENTIYQKARHETEYNQTVGKVILSIKHQGQRQQGMPPGQQINMIQQHSPPHVVATGPHPGMGVEQPVTAMPNPSYPFGRQDNTTGMISRPPAASSPFAAAGNQGSPSAVNIPASHSPAPPPSGPQVPSPAPAKMPSQAQAPSPQGLMDNSPSTPWNPSSMAAGSPGQPAMGPEANKAYVRKLQELQVYVPLVARMIGRLNRQQVDDRTKNEQYIKLNSLYSLLTDKNKRVPLQTLEKCERALEKLFEKPTGGQPTTSTSLSPPYVPNLDFLEPPSSVSDPSTPLTDVIGVSEKEEESKLKQLYIEFYPQLVEAVSDPDTCQSLSTQLYSTSLLSEEKKAVLSSSLASGRSFLKVLGVEEEPHLMAVLMEKMSAVKQLQTLSEDMSSWLSRSKQGAADTQFTGKQAYYERIDFLRGVEVCGETVLEVVGDKPQKVEWPGYGFYIEVPEGALSPGVTASVGVKVILAGQFKLPENRQLISAIYWVSSSEVFLKEVAVNIQHCAIIRSEEQCSDLRFIIARCSQKELPYTFKEREGLFNSHTQYAAIKLKQFSLIGGTASSETDLCCAAFMYYKQQTTLPKIADFHFVLIKNLSPHIQEVKKNYQAECWKKDDIDLCICFEEGVIKLNLTEKQEADPWKIVPLTVSQITKVNVTDYDEGRRIPHCAFECRLHTEEARIFHKVDIIGATTQEFFYIRHCYTEPRGVQPTTDLTPVEPVVPISGTSAPILPSADPLNKPPKTRDLLRRVASRATDKWEMIGIELDIEQHQLNTIAQSSHQDAICCYCKMFKLWQNQADPPFTWMTIVRVLRSPIVEENSLAQEIEDWLREP